MRVVVQKWGNSLAVRIPRAFAVESKLEPGFTLEMTQVKGKIVLTPVSRPAYRLSDLVDGITRTNRHDETDWGPPGGNEAW